MWQWGGMEAGGRYGGVGSVGWAVGRVGSWAGDATRPRCVVGGAIEADVELRRALISLALLASGFGRCRDSGLKPQASGLRRRASGSGSGSGSVSGSKAVAECKQAAAHVCLRVALCGLRPRPLL